MTKDAIFRAYSLTKPLTGVAMMILYEQGKWLPWQPVSKYIPAFAHLKGFSGFDGSGKMMLVDPEHAPTIGEVMSHSAGFSYGFSQSPVDAMYHEKKVLQAANLQEMVEKLATSSVRSAGGRYVGRQRHVFLGRRCGNLVLGRPDQRRCRCLDDSKNDFG